MIPLKSKNLGFNKVLTMEINGAIFKGYEVLITLYKSHINSSFKGCVLYEL